MAIQDRLKKQRYGENYILLPKKYDLLKSYSYSDRNTRYRLLKDDIPSKVLDIYTTPLIKDRYFKHYISIINDYKKYRTTTKNINRLTQRILLDKLIYFKQHHNRYGSFDNYAIAWIVGGLFEMRYHIIRKKIELGEIPPLSHYHTPASNGFYPFPKPMTNKAMLSIANRMYNLLEPYCDYYLSLGLNNNKL